jgi:hypothetical protein
MAFDAHSNGAYSTVLTAPSPATSGTSLVVQSGDGTRFPAVPFNATVYPAGAQPLFANGANAEIVRVTAISTDTFTITRAQEGTSARSIVVGDQIVAGVTKKTLTDIEVPGEQAASATVATSETTTSTTYTDLTTTTDTVTVTIGANGLAFVFLYCNMANSAASSQCYAAYVVSGANIQAATDTQSLQYVTPPSGSAWNGAFGATFLLTGLSTGSTTFKMKYRVNTNTGTFLNRRIAVIPY